MKQHSSTRTEKVLGVMRILTRLGFIGLLIEAGIILSLYCVALIKPSALRSPYVSPVFDRFFGHFIKYTTWFDINVAFLLAFALTAAKAFLFYLLIKFLSKVQLRKPFTLEIVRRIQQISFILLVAAAIVLTNDAHIGWVNHEYGNNIPQDGNMAEYLFMAGLIFIISQVLKRGVELQAENDLTV
jgi:hypothetical protein